ncbi:hypothetical protein [Bombilactobacillus thymidiniphilus]|uniref:Lipoprotein n=1 Tax=Bombilactobacillus thymidiniphilus TaxID=2923363 RepID=A0ABY4PFW0_9LACO|nr:hypothetical protein [Bombilactobacillus thymidiniphilus]UQS84207.1 hypothetical protein MOO47_03390 [Bombilactobacillus thymidiniphilus]
MSIKKVATVMTGLTLLLAGCSASGSFSAKVTPSSQAFKQQITGTAKNSADVYYKTDKKAKKAVKVHKDKFTINVPMDMKKQTVTVSTKKNLSKATKVQVAKPKVVVSATKFAKGFNKTKEVTGKMSGDLPQTNKTLNIMFSPVITYHILANKNQIYSLRLESKNFDDPASQPHIDSLASGLGLKRNSLNDLVAHAKKHKNKPQSQTIKGYYVTATMKDKHLNIDINK